MALRTIYFKKQGQVYCIYAIFEKVFSARWSDCIRFLGSFNQKFCLKYQQQDKLYAIAEIYRICR